MKNPIEELGFIEEKTKKEVSIKEKIENGLVYSNFAYKTDEKEIDELKTKFPKDCELFLYSDYLDDTKES
jgi:hypothetical protein